jgi:hypothetical protein
MKKIYESPYRGINESAVSVWVYELDVDLDEASILRDMNHDERCYAIGVTEESGGLWVLPGALYHSYDFDIVGDGYMVVTDRAALNV